MNTRDDYPNLAADQAAARKKLLADAPRIVAFAVRMGWASYPKTKQAPDQETNIWKDYHGRK